MDHQLVAWGRAVKARRGPACRPLWLFTDPARGDVERAVAALPPGLCGVVFRHDGVAGRASLLRRIAALCRARRLRLSVAGPARGGGPSAIGRHRRGGHGPAARMRVITASAHGVADVVRARRAGAGHVFLSPVFPTASHPGAMVLGPLRWAAAAQRARRLTLALGGIDGRSVRRLPRWTAGVGAIGSLLP